MRCFLLTVVVLLFLLFSGEQPAAAQAWRNSMDSALALWQTEPEASEEMFARSFRSWPDDSLDTKSYSLCIRTWAHAHLQRAEPQQAFAISRNGIRRLEKAGLEKSATCTELQTVLGFWLFEAGRSGIEGALQESIQWFRAALATIKGKEGVRSEAFARACNNLASVLTTIGKYDEAESLLAQSLAARAGIPEREEGYAKTCNTLGNLYWQTGRYREAEEKFRQARDILARVTGKNSLYYAQVCYNLGLVQMALGDFAGAEMHLLRVRTIRVNLLGEEDPAVATATVALGRLYGQMGQVRRSLKWIEDARQVLARAGTASYVYADACSALAGLFSDIDSTDKAIHYYQEALGIVQQVVGAQHTDAQSTASDLAAAYLKAGRHNEALRLLLNIRSSLEAEDNTRNLVYIAVLNNLGQVYLKQDRINEARPLFDTALVLIRRLFGPTHKAAGEIGIQRAVVAWKERDILRADSLFASSVALYFDAIEELAAFTSIKERQKFAEQYAGTWDLVFSFYAQEAVPSSVPIQLALRLKGYLLASEQQFRKAIAGVSDASAQANYQRWADARIRLANLPESADSSMRVALEQEIFLLEKMLTRTSASFAQKTRPPDWPTLRASLRKNEALVLFTEYANSNAHDSLYYLALVIRPEWTLPRVVALFRRQQLAERFRQQGSAGGFYRGVKLGGNKETDSAAGYLIWSKLEPFLEGVRSVYYVPDGLLHQVAFAALSLHPDTLLSEKYQLRQLLSAAALVDGGEVRISKTDRIDLYGGVDYGSAVSENSGLLPRGNWSYLPGTLSEIKGIESAAVSARYHAQLFSGMKASESVFKSRTASAAPAVLHIATHGYFLTGDVPAEGRRTVAAPMFRSGLLLSGALAARDSSDREDGLITAAEVSGMSLDSTRLVVLSACETGLGEIDGAEGVFGLQRGFKMAGAQYLVMSLWKVPDEETTAFMTEFYRHLFSGEQVEVAFDKARATIRSRYRNQFHKWAAWVLVR